MLKCINIKFYIMDAVELIKVDLEGNYSEKLKKAYDKVTKLVETKSDAGYRVITVTPMTVSGNTVALIIVFEDLLEEIFEVEDEEEEVVEKKSGKKAEKKTGKK